MRDIYEILLMINIAALTSVYIHNLISVRKDKPKTKPAIFKKKNKPKELTEEEKRNAEILDQISKYNGMEVKR